SGDGRTRRSDPLPRLGLVGRLFLPLEHHRDAAFRVESDNHVRSLVDGPQVVLSVEANGVRVRPGIKPSADLADELAIRSELEDLRRGGRIRGAACAVGPGEYRNMPF